MKNAQPARAWIKGTETAFTGYWVTSDGRVISHARRKPRELKPQVVRGASYVRMYDDEGRARTVPVHALVKGSWSEPPNPDTTRVEPLDGNLANTALANLAWAPTVKVTPDVIEAVRERGGWSAASLGARFGISATTVAAIWETYGREDRVPQEGTPAFEHLKKLLGSMNPALPYRYMHRLIEEPLTGVGIEGAARVLGLRRGDVEALYARVRERARAR